MPFTLLDEDIQQNVDDASVTINSTGAKLLIAGTSWYYVVDEPTFSDDNGNTWVDLPRYGSAFITNQRIRYCLNPTTVGTGHTVNSTGMTSARQALSFAAFNADGTVSFIDESGDLVIGADTIQAAGFTLIAGQLGITCAGLQENASSTGFGVQGGVGVSNYDSKDPSSGSNYAGGGIGWKITTGTFHPTWDWSAASNASMANAVFAESGSSGGKPTNYYTQQRNQ